MLKYYPNVCNAVSSGILQTNPNATETENMTNKPGYLLWMIKEMQSFTDNEKAARWIGWIIAHAEMLGIMDNTESRRLVRMDVKGT